MPPPLEEPQFPTIWPNRLFDCKGFAASHATARTMAMSAAIKASFMVIILSDIPASASQEEAGISEPGNFGQVERPTMIHRVIYE